MTLVFFVRSTFGCFCSTKNFRFRLGTLPIRSEEREGGISESASHCFIQLGLLAFFFPIGSAWLLISLIASSTFIKGWVLFATISFTSFVYVVLECASLTVADILVLILLWFVCFNGSRFATDVFERYLPQSLILMF